MPTADFLSHFGLYVSKRFLDTELCHRICAETQSVKTLHAGVIVKGNPFFDPQGRSTKLARVSSQTNSLVTHRLLTIKPKLEDFFDLQLTSCQSPQFLVYEPGDFFVAHQDTNTAPEEIEVVRRRKLSTVIFLNTETDRPDRDSYCGGSLTIYGLIKDPRAKKYGFSLLGETGLMVAFRSDLLHEVSPITHGRRCTIASWFY